MSQDAAHAAGNEQLICKSEVLARGWTESMVNALLPTPDEKRMNPHYQKAAPMKLYALRRVLEIEATEEFKRLSAKAQERRVGAAKALHAKQRALMEQVESIAINVLLLSTEHLIKRACESYNSLASERGKYDGFASPCSADVSFLDRICVNYLRHECSSYDANLDDGAARVGVAEARSVIRQKVYDAIAAAYPHLAAECDRQQWAREREDTERQFFR